MQETSFPLIAEYCLPIAPSPDALKHKSSLLVRTSVGKTYLMFVGTDFVIRAFDITYHYEG